MTFRFSALEEQPPGSRFSTYWTWAPPTCLWTFVLSKDSKVDPISFLAELLNLTSYLCIIRSYRSSWLGMGVLGAFSCCTGDAFASALGSRLTNDGDVFLITTFEKVPKVVFFY